MSRLGVWCSNVDVSGSTTVTYDGLRILPFNELSFVVESNRDGKLTLEQGIDASTYQFNSVRHVTAGEPVEVKFPVNTEYGRLKYENTSALDTSGFHLASYGFSNSNNAIYNSNDNIVLIDGTLGSLAATSSVDIRHLKQIDIFGNVSSGAYHLDVQYSANDSDWYRTMYDVSAGSSGDFHLGFASGAKYLRLKNRLSMDISMEAILSGKY